MELKSGQLKTPKHVGHVILVIGVVVKPIREVHVKEGRLVTSVVNPMKQKLVLANVSRVGLVIY